MLHMRDDHIIIHNFQRWDQLGEPMQKAELFVILVYRQRMRGERKTHDLKNPPHLNSFSKI